MKSEKEIYLERITNLAGREAGRGDPDTDTQAALAENRALNTLAATGEPPPPRDATIAAAMRNSDRALELERNTMANPILNLINGRRWYWQAALIILIAAVFSALVFMRPTVQRDPEGQVVLTPLPPAWAAEPGYLLSRNLGELPIEAITDIAGEVKVLLSEELDGTVSDPESLAYEMEVIDDGYRLRLALPTIPDDRLSAVRSRLTTLVDAYALAAPGEEQLESVMLLLSPDEVGGESGRFEWQPASRLPDLDRFTEKLRSVIEHSEGDRHISIKLDIVDDQVTMRIEGDDEVEIIGPVSRHEGRSAVMLRDVFDNEAAVAWSVGIPEGFREFGPDEFDYSEFQTADIDYRDGSYNYSYSFATEVENSDYESAIFAYTTGTDGGGIPAAWSEGTDAADSCGLTSYAEGDEFGGWTQSAGTSKAGTSQSSSSSTASGGVSASANATTTASGGTTATSSATNTAGTVTNSTLECGEDGDPYVCYSGSEVYRKHYRILNKYIQDTYDGGPVKMTARGADEILRVEIEVDGVKDEFVIKAGEDGELQLIHSEQ